jgi:hypothetical protein
MIRTAAKKVAWVGRTAAMVFGLALVLAVMLGLATAALAGTGVGAAFNLGKLNTVNRISQLVGSLDDAMLRIDNNNSGTNATALDLQVEMGHAPMKINSSTQVANLNADQLDGKDESAFLGKTEKAADSETLDGKDSTAFLASDAAAPLKGYEIRHASSGLSQQVTPERTVFVDCPSGKKPIGGGGSVTSSSLAQNKVAIVESIPLSQSWKVVGRAMESPFNSAVIVHAYVICAVTQ